MLENQLSELKAKLETVTCFIERSELEGEIEDIEVRLGQKAPPKAIESDFECIGCSS